MPIQRHRGAPTKPDEEKSVRVSISVPKKDWDKFVKYLKDDNDSPSTVLCKDILRHNEAHETVEAKEQLSIQKHKELQEFAESLRAFDQAIIDDRQLEEKCARRADDTYYIMDVQRLVTSMRKDVSVKRTIKERVKRISNQYGYPVKFVKLDVDTAMAERVREEETVVEQTAL